MNATKIDVCEIQTWMKAVTGHIGSLQLLCKLVCEQDVAQLAVGIDLKDIDETIAHSKLLVCAKTVEVNGTHVV